MKLQDLFKIVPDTVNINMVFAQLMMTGTKESMDIMLSEEMQCCDVDNIEARENVLWVWVE